MREPRWRTSSCIIDENCCVLRQVISGTDDSPMVPRGPRRRRCCRRLLGRQRDFPRGLILRVVVLDLVLPEAVLDRACERARDRILGLADDARVKRNEDHRSRTRREEKPRGLSRIAGFATRTREKTEERTRFDGADSVVDAEVTQFRIYCNSRHFITRRRAASFPSLSLL